jgi:membrane protein
MVRQYTEPGAFHSSHIPMSPAQIWRVLKDVYDQWQNDEPFQLAAALAYYTVFSLAPLLVIVIAVAGFAFGEEAAQNRVFEAIQGLVGRDGARAIQDMIRHADKEASSLWAGLWGLALLLIGAGGVVGQLQSSLNKIWDVKSNVDYGWTRLVYDRFLSFALILGIGFLLLVSLILTAVVSAASSYYSRLLPQVVALWPIVDILISFALTTTLFALIYKVLPDAHVAWKEVWIGAAITALLFSLGKLVIGIYLGESSISSAYGAAGSLVTILLWVYYSSLIFFFGAELTKYYSKNFGSGAHAGPPRRPQVNALSHHIPLGRGTAKQL